VEVFVAARLTVEQRRRVIRLAALGRTHREIIDEVGVSAGTVHLLLKPLGGVFRTEMWQVCDARLSLEDRVAIGSWLAQDVAFAEIGRRLRRATSTISREVGGVEGRQRYKPVHAHRRAYERVRRPKPTKLAAHPVLCQRVANDLAKLWSPDHIAGRLRREFPDNPEMWVSHETIYKSLFVQGRGELRRELARCLRTGRTQRKPRRRVETRGRIVDMVPISQRPAEVADRAVPGHWEGDLVLGAGNRSAVGTLVERTSRFTVLLHLPEGYAAPAVRAAATEAIIQLPEAMRRTITWDQGKEMAEHAQFTVDTGVQIYFCDPHAPWQRPTNENTNGLLRQYLPKGTDLRGTTAADLQAIQDSLNARPRKGLGYMTPSEKFAELVASTG
jgi:IS30 family transposase